MAAPAPAPFLLYIQKSKLKALNKVKINALIYPTLCCCPAQGICQTRVPEQCWWQQAGLAPVGHRGTVAPEAATRHCPSHKLLCPTQHAVAAAFPADFSPLFIYPWQCDHFTEPTAASPHSGVFFTRNMFGSKIYAHLLCRKPNIQLFQEVPFYFSPSAPTLPF